MKKSLIVFILSFLVISGCIQKKKKDPLKEKAQDIFARAKVEAEVARLDMNTDSICWVFLKLDSAKLAFNYALKFDSLVKAELNNPNAKIKERGIEIFELENYKKKVAVITRNFVKANLKNPKSADFPSSNFTVLKSKGNQYFIESYVDSKNAFNAEIRNKYKALIEYKGGDWSNINNWQLIELKFE